MRAILVLDSANFTPATCRIEPFDPNGLSQHGRIDTFTKPDDPSHAFVTCHVCIHGCFPIDAVKICVADASHGQLYQHLTNTRLRDWHIVADLNSGTLFSFFQPGSCLSSHCYLCLLAADSSDG